MRACFLGQGVTALGFGVATLQTPPLAADEGTAKPLEGRTDRPCEAIGGEAVPQPLLIPARRRRVSL